MRIAIPIHSFEPGGVERVALRLAQRWEEAGHEPVIVLGRKRGASTASAPELDYRTLREPFSTDRWETMWMIWSLFQFLLEEKVDAIFCAGNTYTIVCVAMKALLGDRCPPVLVKISNDLERSDLPKPVRPLYRWWLRTQAAHLDGFVAIADPMKPEVERALGIPKNRVDVIPDPALANAELQELFQGKSNSQAAPGCRFLTVGRLVAQKNQALLLDAFARHAWPKDTLIIAGDGPERQALFDRAKSLDLHPQVTFLGHVDDVRSLYAEADVFVLSSRYEGAPAVILEALAAGLPIAATNCCSSMDWLTGHGQFGVTVPVDDPDALGLAMNVARHQRPDRVAMRDFATKFTLESSATIYLSRFANLIAEVRRQRQRALLASVGRWRSGSA